MRFLEGGRLALVIDKLLSAAFGSRHRHAFALVAAGCGDLLGGAIFRGWRKKVGIAMQARKSRDSDAGDRLLPLVHFLLSRCGR